MNVETRYLIRWGIPGWILIIAIAAYHGVRYYDAMEQVGEDLIKSSPEILAASAFFIIIGIPIGYVLNQIHHVWIWVIRVDCKKYFDMELELNEIFFTSKNGAELHNRYRYLLTRIHELGGIVAGLSIAIIYTLIYSFIYDFSVLVVIYITIIITTFAIIFISRNYYRKNLDAYTMALVSKDYRSVRNRGLRWLGKSRIFNRLNV